MFLSRPRGSQRLPKVQSPSGCNSMSKRLPLKVYRLLRQLAGNAVDNACALVVRIHNVMETFYSRQRQVLWCSKTVKVRELSGFKFSEGSLHLTTCLQDHVKLGRLEQTQIRWLSATSDLITCLLILLRCKAERVPT